MPEQNRQIRLASRPSGPIRAENFQHGSAPLPELADGDILVRCLYVSVDPTMRGWMERDTYLPAIEIGAVIRSTGGGVVVESKNPDFRPGDRVVGLVGWQEYAKLGPKDRATPVPKGVALPDALSVFGMTGLTAYFGMTEIGKPQAGETVVVSGAAGATGSVAGQIAKSMGCRVIGIAGTAKKCRWLTEELGFDGAINYKEENVGKRLSELCPKRIDVYFDNVGGPILDMVLARLAIRGRIVVCGGISQYDNMTDAFGPKNYLNLVSCRGKMEGFLILDFAKRFGEGVMKLAALAAEGKLKHKVTIVDGLDKAPEALGRLFTGDHEGKLLVKVADDSAS